MSDTTAHYGLPTGMVADDFIEPNHHNMLADTLDRILGSFLKQIMADGALSGWELTGDAQVDAGEGIIAGCYCRTVQAADISGLTDDAVNYIYAATTGTSPQDGSVTFTAQTVQSAPPGAIYLGTITLDDTGQVTDYDSEAEGVDRNLRLLEIAHVGDSGIVEDVADGDTATVTIDHSSDVLFIVPGAIDLQVTGNDFDWAVKEAYREDGFILEATNTSGAAADFEYSWTRYGFRR
ncbi:MAG: hypothetical protein R6V19_00100 [Armatimonadota bacterium]